MGFLKDFFKPTTLAEDFKFFGKTMLNGIKTQYEHSNYEYSIRSSGITYQLTYDEHLNGKDLYRDQFGDLWCTENGGESFYKY